MNKYELTKQLKLAVAGDNKAKELIILYYEPKIQAIIEYFSKNYPSNIIDKEDIRQQCYLGILSSLKYSTYFTENFYKHMCKCVRDLYFQLQQSVSSTNIYELSVIPNDIEDSLVKICKLFNVEYIEDLNILYKDFENQCIAKITVNELKLILNDKEFDILWKHNVENWTLAEIGKKYHVNKERVRQIELRAINKCKYVYGKEYFYE